MPPTESTPASGPIAIVGRGKLGTALAAALRDAGLTVLGPLGRGATFGDSRVAILCVPDREITNVVRSVPSGMLVAHCSGVSSLAAFEGREGFGFHPLLSVTPETKSFAGVGCAVQASSERGRKVCSTIVNALGMVPFELDETLRPLYHAAASVGSNYVLAVEMLAEELMAKCGVDRRHLFPLVRSATDNWMREGAESLTGPIARGDEETVARQRAAVAANAPQMLQVWDALADATRAVAARSAAGSVR